MEEGGSLTVEERSRRRSSGAPDQLRAGIVGTGFIGRVHARSARMAGARVVGVAASSPERAGAAREEVGAEVGFPTAEEMIASDSIDVVHVCAPNHLHVPLTRAALAAGKHVVCEKPVALSAAEAESVAELARSTGLVVTVPFAYRYYPTVREARARVAQGRIGESRVIYGGYLQDWLLRPDDDNWRIDARLGGPSRAFADIGAHWCDLVEFVSGERIASLTASLAIAHPERAVTAARSFEAAPSAGATRAVETEDIATLLFQTGGGATGSVMISQVSPGRKNHLWFEIAGTEAAVGFDQEQPESLWFGSDEGGLSVPRDARTLSPDAAAYITVPGGHPQGFQDCFDAFVEESYRAMSGESPAEGLPTIEDGVRAVRITESVLGSAAERAWVEVPA